MSWWAVDVRPLPERRDVIGSWLVARTGQAIEEREDGTLVTFAQTEAEAEALMSALEREHATAATRRPLEAVDWSTRWRDGIAARRFGRLTVRPSWIVPHAVRADEVSVVLDPETAFGTGEHGSTRAALSLLERHLRGGERVLDLGSGSGILAIAAVKLGAARATGIEVDLAANEIASRNAIQNDVADRTMFVHGDAGDLAPLLGPADILLSNILRTVNVKLLIPIRAALRQDGLAIFSGMEVAEAPLFRPELIGSGFTPVDEVTDTGWWAVAARRSE